MTTNLKDDPVWVTNTGQKLRVSDMSEEHAKNILRMLLRRHSQVELLGTISAIQKIPVEGYRAGKLDQLDYILDWHDYW